MATTVEQVFSETSVNVLLDKLVTGAFEDNFKTMMLDVSLLRGIKSKLVQLQVVLQNAEEKRITTNLNTLGDWFEMLRDVVFEVDSLFDRIKTEALRCKVESRHQTPTSQVLNNHLSSPFKRFNRKGIKSELKGLIETLQSVVQKSDDVWDGTQTSSSLIDDESCIFGRDGDKKKLKHLLLSSDCDSEIRVISITGMGGIGKTTLAKLLYNDPEVDGKFGLKLWADFSSRDFDTSRMFETILKYIASPTYPSLLLVLDNVSGLGYFNSRYLMEIYNATDMGSRIIVTTRDERVEISMPYPTYVHYLRPLECESCWSLIANHAFGACNYQQHSNLEEIGREIAKKCGGLPLIALALGTLLRTNISPNYWNYVLERNIWELRDYEVQAALRLSYRYLSDPLKLCFAYCSTFPKKSILEKKMVVPLWIAENLVESSTGQKSLEKVGEEYFDELVSRSLIQRRSIGDVEDSFEMHNFVHDLATNSLSEYPIRSNNLYRHSAMHIFSYNRGLYDSVNKFDKMYRMDYVSTFLALPILQKQQPFCLLSNKVVHDLLPTLKQLRMLSLSNYKSITEVPNTIGNLLYLRYLNLSHTMIERLPSETCKLYNLQFLLLSGCKRLTELPGDMGKLVNLRHLDVSGTALRELPLQIAKLENLHTLLSASRMMD